MIKYFFTFLIINCLLIINLQAQTFSRDDTLRGSITPERSWWDLKYYELRLEVKLDAQHIAGSTTIFYDVLHETQTMQIDLQKPLEVERILQDGQTLIFKRDGNAFFVDLIKPQKIGKKESIQVFFAGKPRTAKNAPWDGGFSWSKDTNGNHFVATSCQGLGASAWWACKDHAYDEPDSMLISITVPKDYTDISNGRLRKITENKDDTHTFDWFVSNPINNYGVNVNIAKYVNFNEVYEGEKGKLAINYYVLPENLEKAQIQFQQTPKMLKAFEHWFGAYPFYEDGFKLVEVPYLGMEHQSSVTYGNKYKNGYLGRDLSGTGWGLKWDFIIVHESGHEWFANNITYKDAADMWIHESFTNYSEGLFTEYYFGKEAGATYMRGLRATIRNDKPIIGVYHVNQEGSSDMYNKGGNMLHTIRQVISDDEKWRSILRGLNQTFYHKTVESKEIENYMSQKACIDLSKIFDQYLRTIQIPVLTYKIKDKKICYRWENCVAGFDMPIQANIDGVDKILAAKTTWQSINHNKAKQLKIAEDYYVNNRKIE